MKNILVPTDFSDCARHAAMAALAIAEKARADIHFLHIMQDTEIEFHKPQPPKNPKQRTQDSNKGFAQNELNAWVARAAKLGINAVPMLVVNKGNERIEDYIAPLKIDMIVMGSHGATGIREWVIGSNTQRVVHNASVPVLVIKQPVTDPFKIQSIIFASTFQEVVTDAFEIVVRFARLWKATVNVFFINFKDKLADQETINQVVLNLVKPYPDISYTINSAETNDEEWAIHQLSEQLGADMIALTTHDKTGFLLRHQVAEDLVNHESAPVLVMGDHG